MTGTLLHHGSILDLSILKEFTDDISKSVQMVVSLFESLENVDQHFNPLPNNKFLDVTKWKAFADKKMKCC